MSEDVVAYAFAQLECTLYAEDGSQIAVSRHVADPAVSWAEDGTTALERLSDYNLVAGRSVLSFTGRRSTILI